MALEKTFGLERLVAASACATQLRLYGYQEIRRILERGDDADFLSKTTLSMKLHGMAAAFTESLTSTMAETAIDSFLHMLLAGDEDYRYQCSHPTPYTRAAFRYKACLEQIDYAIPRGLDRNQMERLASLEFIRKGQNTSSSQGSSGTGKSFLATAMGYEACKKGIRTYYANP